MSDKEEEKQPSFVSGGAIPDFNVELEYVPEPRVPDGVYNGLILGLKYNDDYAAVQWEIALQSNEGVSCDNGTTPVDGIKMVLNNWMPIPGDETIVGKNGLSKRVNKINMLRRFGKEMGLNLNLPSDFQELIDNRSLVGSSVVVTLKSRIHEGKLYYDVKKMTRVT